MGASILTLVYVVIGQDGDKKAERGIKKVSRRFLIS
jgi:hypothetical protein